MVAGWSGVLGNFQNRPAWVVAFSHGIVASMSEASLLTVREGPLVELCLNRPASKNSLDSELVDALGRTLDVVSSDETVRVIVITGSGGAFCSGVDLRSAAADLDAPARLAARLDGFHHLIRAINRADQPVVAAIDGPAVGFGADLAFACDLRIASTRAYFEEKFVTIGLMPDGGGTYHLPRLIGVGRALEQLLLGTRIDAPTALAIGLVNRVIEPSAFAEESRAWALRLAAQAPLAVRAVKRAVHEGLSSTLDEALNREREGQLSLLTSSDAREGVSAFFERRAPVFRGQ
jgi:2-(1,2-epoxy-1,2-dihydrophenyl)acetyl-CoA isomerase